VGSSAAPVYEQPECPVEGYIWTPGYWAGTPISTIITGYGVWVLLPSRLLWTPGVGLPAVLLRLIGLTGGQPSVLWRRQLRIRYTGNGYWGDDGVKQLQYKPL